MSSRCCLRAQNQLEYLRQRIAEQKGRYRSSMAALERISSELHDRRRQSATPSPSDASARLDAVLTDRRNSTIGDVESTASLDSALLDSLCSSIGHSSSSAQHSPQSSITSADEGLCTSAAPRSEAETYRPATVSTSPSAAGGEASRP